MKDPEIRVNPWTGASVIVAPLRAARPHQFEAAKQPESQSDTACPFCRGNEPHTPEALVALDAQGLPASNTNWQVRVIPNKFPAVSRQLSQPSAAGLPPEVLPAYGSHEVVIESPQHVSLASQIPKTNLELTLLAIAQRVAVLKEDSRIQHVQVFKNCGEAAGASVVHTHSQIIALPQLPLQVSRATQQEADVLATHHVRLWEQVTSELGDHVVGESANLLAFCPPFAALPFELWIGSKSTCDLAWHSQAIRAELAKELSRYTRRIEELAGGCAWNWYLQETGGVAGHWHIAIIPRLTSIAGFEWATGMTINPMDPRSAAAELRS